MSKTLAIILNHNLPEYTDWLYQELKRGEGELYDLRVMDNGSRPEGMPATVHYRLEKNIYLGGAWNEAFRIVLENPQYDSLLFLNNDIEVNGRVFVKLLRDELFRHDYAILSPCVAGRPKAWNQMQNWGSKEPRQVRWTDFESPMFHRKIIEAVGQFSTDLYYGWGQELVCADLCAERGWKIAICDHVAILHYGNQTLIQNRLYHPKDEQDQSEEKPAGLTETQTRALQEYRDYFSRNPLKHGTLDEYRTYGQEYQFVQTDAEKPTTGRKTTGNWLKSILGQ